MTLNNAVRVSYVAEISHALYADFSLDYELVRFYHPDAASARQREPDASRRHTHFSAITRAYASLQKRSSDGVTDEKEESRRAHSVWQRPPHTRSWRNFEEAANADERWKDRLIWGGLCFVSSVYIMDCSNLTKY